MRGKLSVRVRRQRGVVWTPASRTVPGLSRVTLHTVKGRRQGAPCLGWPVQSVWTGQMCPARSLGGITGESIVRLAGGSRTCRNNRRRRCRLSSSCRYRVTPLSHYCELSHCGVTTAAYAADSVFFTRYKRAGAHVPPPVRCSIPGPIKDGDSLSGKSSIKRLSGS